MDLLEERHTELLVLDHKAQLREEDLRSCLGVDRRQGVDPLYWEHSHTLHCQEEDFAAEGAEPSLGVAGSLLEDLQVAQVSEVLLTRLTPLGLVVMTKVNGRSSEKCVLSCPSEGLLKTLALNSCWSRVTHQTLFLLPPFKAMETQSSAWFYKRLHIATSAPA